MNKPEGMFRDSSDGSTVDELMRALNHFRPKLNRALSIAERAQNFWAIVVAVRDLAAADVLREDLMDYARSTGLMGDLGRHGSDDIEHLIRWGLLKRWPFDGRVKAGGK